jgi:ATP-dependent DNA helicase RecQ
VRTVAHWALPTSLEAYYQEAGRGGRDGRPARALLLAARMDLGRLIRFINERETSVEEVKRYVARLRLGAERETVAIGHGELSERDRVLLSIAERAGAVELQPGGREGLLVSLTGRGSPRKAYMAIKAARDRGWESYRSIERFSADTEICRRRQILDHFGDEEEGRPSGRCCDVCEPDPTLERLASAPITRGSSRRSGRGGGSGRRSAQPPEAAVDAEEFETLRAWRWERAEGKPAYTVAANTVLEEVLRRRPANMRQLVEVRGVGQSFCERHGASMLAAVRELDARRAHGDHMPSGTGV